MLPGEDLDVNNLTLITGGVRSGKSLFAESIAKQSSKSIHYIATMPVLPGDSEQQERIQKHRVRRPKEWQTVEAPYTLPDAIAGLASTSGLCLVDCLTVYISNIILGDTPDSGPSDPYAMESRIVSEVEAVLQNVRAAKDMEFLIVTNEVGWGVVPDNQLARAFRDFVGIANQLVAKEAANVYMMCSGIPMKVK
jgi:adenosylcobinamide kinase/adenosylcobinamide-phosphate guanylyltransferase